MPGALGLLLVASALPAQQPTAPARPPSPPRPDSVVAARGDSVSIRLVDVDLRGAVQALSQYLDRPIVFGGAAAGAAPQARVTLETPRPVPRADVTRLLRGVLESQSFELVEDTAANIYRVQPKAPPKPPAPEPGAIQPGGPVRQPVAPELFVIHLRHARAADVAATVNALYGRASALGEPGGGASGGAGVAPTLGQQLQQQQVPPYGTPVPPQVAPGAAGRVAALTGETTIVPDPGTNSLLIRANRGDFDLIAAAVKELDVRPLQVLIEVLIAEVRKDHSWAFGVDAKIPRTRLTPKDPNATIEGATSSGGAGLGDFVVRVMNLGHVELDATLTAAAARGDAKIVSRPVVLASNNEAAQILVGSQRPFVQVARTLPTDNAARDQVVQYKEVGTKLTVRPTISADGGYVQLAVTQEVNQATAETQFDAPVISTRTVQTNLLVRDSQTVVLGGLTDKQREATQGGVPILSAIPVLGGVFGHAGRRTTETEFFLFITPRVIRSDEQAESVTQPMEKRARRVKP